jgi:hypothetical protein
MLALRPQRMTALPETTPRGPSQPQFRPRSEHLRHGKSLRQVLPREAHGPWLPADPDRDPIAILEASNQDRLPELIPIRYGRMLPPPSNFCAAPPP